MAENVRRITVADGEEALRVAHAELPDLVLLDVVVPKLQAHLSLQDLVQKVDAALAGTP